MDHGIDNNIIILIFVVKIWAGRAHSCGEARARNRNMKNGVLVFSE